ncbi:MAG: hypothetical protein ACKVIH_01505 [Burkholderiales bacterium]
MPDITKHLVIRDAIADLLQAAPALAGGRIYENREYLLPATASSSIQVFRDDSVPNRADIMGAPVDWRTRLRIVVKARTATGISAETAADVLSASIYARILAAAQTGLGGLASDVEQGQLTWQQDEAETGVATCEMEFYILHRTEANTIT